MDDKKSIFIPGNVPSSKNSKQWTGKFLVSSKTVKNYLKAHEGQYLDLRDDFLELIKDKEFPLKIGFYFVRDSRRRFDFINLMQIIADLMVDHKWLPDDSADYFVPVFLGYHVDKFNPGVYLYLDDNLTNQLNLSVTEFKQATFL